MDPLLWLDRLFGTAPWFPYVVWLVLFAIAIGFMIRAIRRVWRPLKRFVLTIDTLAVLPEFTVKTGETLERLRIQVENDHDTNLREELTETVEGVRGLKESGEILGARLQLVETGVAGLYGKVDDLEASDVKATERLSRIEKTLTPAEVDVLRRIIKKEGNQE